MKKLLVRSSLIILAVAFSALSGFLICKNSLKKHTLVGGESTPAQLNKDSVLQAIGLLPDTSDITQIQKIQDSLFWILRDTKADTLKNGIVGGRRYESWISNTDTQTATLGQARNGFNGFLVSGIQKIPGCCFFEVHHEIVSLEELIDYYHVSSGAFAFSTEWSHYWRSERGNTIDITKDGKTIQMYLAPPIDFQPNLKDQEDCNKTYNVTVDALVVNDKQLKFKKPHRISYAPIYYHGECAGWNYSNLGRPVFDELHTVYFDLPWDERVAIDIDHLDVTGVSIEEKPDVTLF